MRLTIWPLTHSYLRGFDAKKATGNARMQFFNTFGVLPGPLARKITEIGLNSAEIDILTSELYAVLGRIPDNVRFPDLPKNISAEKLATSNLNKLHRIHIQENKCDNSFSFSSIYYWKKKGMLLLPPISGPAYVCVPSAQYPPLK